MKMTLTDEPKILDDKIKLNVKHIAKSESDFNYDGKYKFYRCCKQYDEFEETSRDSKQNKMEKFKRPLDNF